MSELHAEYVKRGYWVNHSQGSLMGQTITTDIKTGSIIIALLAVCTTMGTAHLWHIITFIYHQVRANGKPADGLFRQQQALLRTMPSPSTLMADSVKLFFSWKRGPNQKKMLGHTLAQTLVALAFALASVAASIFSSYAVSSSSIEVLVQSPYCGTFEDTEVRNTRSYLGKVMGASTQYGSECYQGKGQTPARCNIFVRPNIEFKMENVTCPFDSSICASHGIAFDTGLWDLNTAFGTNLADQDRMKIRKRTTCAALSLENRVTLRNMSELPAELRGRAALPEEQVLLFHYGNRTSDQSEWNNVTFAASLTEQKLSRGLKVNGGIIHRASWGDDNPIKFLPELIRPEGDTVILRINKGAIRYYQPVDDPIFAAHQVSNFTDIANGRLETIYKSDTPVSLLGCLEQTQYCVANKSAGEYCSELSGLPGDRSMQGFPRANKLQVELLKTFHFIQDYFSISLVTDFEASAYIDSLGAVAHLPNDQWIREIRRWVAIGWSAAQVAISDYAVGPKVRDPNSEALYTFPPTSEAGKSLCGVQKMRKGGGFVNIDVFALSFILAFSALVAILDITLLRFVIFMSRFRKALSPRIERWIQDGVFQLQRRAYEAHGEGTWERTDKEIPVVTNNEELRDLPESALPFPFPKLRHMSSLPAYSSRTNTSNDSPTFDKKMMVRDDEIKSDAR